MLLLHQATEQIKAQAQRIDVRWRGACNSIRIRFQMNDQCHPVALSITSLDWPLCNCPDVQVSHPSISNSSCRTSDSPLSKQLSFQCWLFDADICAVNLLCPLRQFLRVLLRLQLCVSCKKSKTGSARG